MTATARDPSRFVFRFPDSCCAEVTRRGESQLCDRVAVAVAVSTEEYDPDWWPVCQRHLRGRELVSPQDLLAAHQGAAASDPFGFKDATKAKEQAE